MFSECMQHIIFSVRLILSEFFVSRYIFFATLSAFHNHFKSRKYDSSDSSIWAAIQLFWKPNKSKVNETLFQKIYLKWFSYEQNLLVEN